MNELIVMSISRRKLIRFIKNMGEGLFVTTAFGVLLSCQKENTVGFESLSQESSLEMLNETGSFLNEVKRLKDLVLPKQSNLYIPPTQEELKQFEKLAKVFISNNRKEALSLANDLGYQVVKFVDNSTQQTLYGLREKKREDQPMRGWGSYFINTSSKVDVLVEVPHPLFDRFSPEIAANTFIKSAAKGFLIAGAHRHANGKGTADVCDPIQSIFQEVHKSWILSDTKTLQIHGFKTSGKTEFPPQTQVVLSNGEGEVSPEILKLEESLEESGFNTYVYNELSASNPINDRVNEAVAGETFSPLAGTENVQGQYCRRVGTPFIHIELDERLRNSNEVREKVASALSK